MTEKLTLTRDILRNFAFRSLEQATNTAVSSIYELIEESGEQGRSEVSISDLLGIVKTLEHESIAARKVFSELLPELLGAKKAKVIPFPSRKKK